MIKPFTPLRCHQLIHTRGAHTEFLGSLHCDTRPASHIQVGLRDSEQGEHTQEMALVM